MSYKYDVFFSYKRNQLTETWHNKLVEQLEFWLNMEIQDRNVSIFYDKESIEIGDEWKSKIGDAIRHSRCIVAILSPDYFKSTWCYAEILSFLKRQEIIEDSTGLVLGARFHDGHSFPEKVKAIQQEDFSDYASVSDSFWDTRKAAEFGDRIKEFARVIAHQIKNAPEFQQDFPIVIPEEKELLSTKITKLV
ncbi:toll/interleukin-1 receptor domain-containing protein [Aquimarina pacifica]|uniref:toll/interleukin-1 receptor domain-containing protein n=1 Tax=Aquimarina pacifica TaxID=1296415 RepID=UPI000471C7D4|nr:toll/interleukin-1 receptor domain-containing protein [Aquimarina pacifica]